MTITLTLVLVCFSRREMFPTEDTPNMLFKGIPFKDVPIVNIRVSKNNTIFSLSDGKTGMCYEVNHLGKVMF